MGSASHARPICRDLHRSTGATNATLSDRLKVLKQNELLKRRKYQSQPDWYEYVLTAKGGDLGLVLLATMQVGHKWNQAGLDGPHLCLIDGHSGHHVRVTLVDAETGERISPKHVPNT
jgi:hypothetical protein